VRNGSVVDLQIECGQVRAMVSGSDIYSVKIEPLSSREADELLAHRSGRPA
jgi:uncharacterized Zn finger protein